MSIPDVIAPRLTVLFCGINPGLMSEATGHHFARPGNRFWPALHLSGFTPHRLRPCDQTRLIGYHIGITNVVDRPSARADELSRDRSLPKFAQAITLYHLIVEATLAQPGQHFIEDFFASEETMPGFSEGMSNVSKDEQRHIGFGVKVLSELLAEGSPGWEENRAAVVELLRETLPYGPAVFYPPGFDREYTECYGFSLEDIFAFGLKLIRQRWRTIGYPTEEMPPGVLSSMPWPISWATTSIELIH